MTNISTSASVLIPRPRHEVFALATDSTNASLLRSRGPFAGIPCPRRPRAEKPVNDYLHRPAEELYDPEADPDEQHNIADDPEVRALKLDLSFSMLCRDHGRDASPCNFHSRAVFRRFAG